jgi:hypothetical protein
VTAERAFELTWDRSLFGDDEHIASLVRFPGSENIVRWASPRTIEVPDTIYFEANVQTLRQLDYPENDVNWPIMSARMRETLLSLGPVAHRLVPVIMLDDTVPTGDRFDTSGQPRPGVAVKGFAAMQLLEHVDALDWERSDCTKDDRLAGRVRRLRRLVLRDVPLPPIFRLSAQPIHLFVSAATREALDRTGIKGAQYYPLDTVRS